MMVSPDGTALPLVGGVTMVIVTGPVKMSLVRTEMLTALLTEVEALSFTASISASVMSLSVTWTVTLPTGTPL